MFKIFVCTHSLVDLDWRMKIHLYFMQVNYLHSHGMAHTELRLENVHVSPVDKHVKVSIISFYFVLAVMLTLRRTLINQCHLAHFM
jgi:hypothetical protein